MDGLVVLVLLLHSGIIWGIWLSLVERMLKHSHLIDLVHPHMQCMVTDWLTGMLSAWAEPALETDALTLAEEWKGFLVSTVSHSLCPFFGFLSVYVPSWVLSNPSKQNGQSMETNSGPFKANPTGLRFPSSALVSSLSHLHAQGSMSNYNNPVIPYWNSDWSDKIFIIVPADRQSEQLKENSALWTSDWRIVSSGTSQNWLCIRTFEHIKICKITKVQWLKEKKIQKTPRVV